MLALLGLAVIVVMLAAILTNRMSPLVALIVVPVLGALAGGFGLQTGKFVVAGIQAIAPVAGMFIFAILFFGIMTDAGLLDPIIDRILAVVGCKPTRIVTGSALLSLLVHLDGSGAVTFLVTIPAMLPLYERLGMDKRVLACVVSMAAGVNFLPWVGPVIRAAAAINVTVTDIFIPLIPAQIVGLAMVFGVAWLLGRREERRLGARAGQAGQAHRRQLTAKETSLRRPGRFRANLAVTLVVMAVLITGWVDPVVMFMVGTVLALLINYPDVRAQRERVDAHAGAALLMGSILLAAGAFTGIMKGTRMLASMAEAAVSVAPADMVGHIPFLLGLCSMPLSLLFDPDSYYFGVMPVIAEVYRAAGGDPLQVAQASVLGQMTTGFPVSPLTPSTFLVVGLTGVSLAEHQKFSIPFLFGASVLMTLVCAVLGVFAL